MRSKPELMSLMLKRGTETKAGEWPCPECWGDKCGRCSGAGFVSHASFRRWYTNLVTQYYEELDTRCDELDDLYASRSDLDSYTVRNLRRFSRRS